MFDSKATRDLGALLLIGASFTGLVGCSQSGSVDFDGPANTTPLGESIYQLPASDWPKNLVEFKAAHPELRIVDTEVASSTGHGLPTSFVVVTEPINSKSLQSEVDLKDFTLPSR